jgi:hypothetical protein
MRTESLIYFFLAALTFAQRALAAALILAIPAGEILRFGRTVADVAWTLFCFAHHARWAAAIRRRAEADIERFGDTLGALPFREAWIAWSMRARSCLSSWIMPSMFDMGEILHRNFWDVHQIGAKPEG